MAGPRRWIWLVLRLTGTVLAIGYVASKAQPGAAIAALLDAPGWLWFVPAAALMFNTAVQAIRLRLVLDAAGCPTPFGRVMGALCRGSFLGLTLPSGGQEIAKAAFLSRASGRMDAALTALLTMRVLQLPTWLLFLVWGLASGLWHTHPLLGASATGFLCVAGAVLCASMWGLFRAPHTGVWLPTWVPARLGELIERMAGALIGLRAHPRTLLWVALLAVPCGFLNTAVVWMIAMAYGVDFGLGSALALIPAADVVIWLPISISGIGVRESMMVQVFEPRGVAEATAVAIGLTRWTGELFRAAIGGLLFVLGDTDNANESNRSSGNG